MFFWIKIVPVLRVSRLQKTTRLAVPGAKLYMKLGLKSMGYSQWIKTLNNDKSLIKENEQVNNKYGKSIGITHSRLLPLWRGSGNPRGASYWLGLSFEWFDYSWCRKHLVAGVRNSSRSNENIDFIDSTPPTVMNHAYKTLLTHFSAPINVFVHQSTLVLIFGGSGRGCWVIWRAEHIFLNLVESASM